MSKVSLYGDKIIFGCDWGSWMDELEGKVALITGASRDIGEATACELASRGVAVVLAARTGVDIEKIAAEIRGSGGQAQTISCDIAQYDDVAAAVAYSRSAFGSLDILVNNAGVIKPIARLAESESGRMGLGGRYQSERRLSRPARRDPGDGSTRGRCDRRSSMSVPAPRPALWRGGATTVRPRRASCR